MYSGHNYHIEKIKKLNREIKVTVSEQTGLLMVESYGIYGKADWKSLILTV